MSLSRVGQKDLVGPTVVIFARRPCCCFKPLYSLLFIQSPSYHPHMSNRDTSRQVGQWVHAKATHATREVECRRRYCSLSATKWLDGVVKDVVQEPTPTNRVSTLIIAKCYLYNWTAKLQRLNISSVRSGRARLKICASHQQSTRITPAATCTAS